MMVRSKDREVVITGLSLSKGNAVGNVCMFNENRHSNLPMYKIDDKDAVEHEAARIERAISLAAEQLEKVRAEVEKKIGKAEAEIFVAQKMILEDETLSREIMDHIRDEGVNSEYAIAHVLDDYESRVQAIDDEYIRERASDFGEIKRRILDELGYMKPSLQCDKGHCQKGKNRIIVADELTPSLTVDIDAEHTIGFVTEHGGVNSHAAILARAMGIPAVSGLRGIREKLGCGTELLINGAEGTITIWPSDETVAKAITVDPATRGMPDAIEPVSGFKVMANINWASDMLEGKRMQAEGIGLYRTEFEIMAAERFLTEDELYERYVSVGEAMGGSTVIFRLFDMGSDKSLPFMNIPTEQNPSLGWRGARLLLGKKEVLETQARALARTSHGGRIHVMYPMIIDVAQFLEIKDAFMRAVQGIDYGEILHGIMFEVPSACLQARELYKEIDFASIGTNDLTQYLFAVDRENDMVSYDYDSDRPVFWKLIKEMAQAAQDAGKPLSVCGELGGDPEYVAKLVEAGINTVSVSPRRISAARKAAKQLLV